MAQIDRPSLFYASLVSIWLLIADVLGGTRRMREAGKAYLPQQVAESDDNYQLRLKTATFEPLFKTLSTNLAGRAFDTAIQIGNEKEDAEFTAWLEDIDLRGNNCNAFAQEVFQRLIEFGLVYIFAEHTRTPGGLTKADEKALNARPYLVSLRPQDVLMVRYSDTDSTRMEEVRIRETAIVWEGDAQVKKDRIRVLKIGSYELFERTEGKDKEHEWVSIDKGAMSLSFIPLVPIYAQKDDCEPPLLEAAYLNIKYYQFESSHDNALSVAQFPILTAIGVEKDSSIVIGPKKLLRSDNANARFAYLEHSGVAINCGRDRLDDIRRAISSLGTKLLMSQAQGGGVTKTATENKIDDKQNMCVLKLIATRFADGLAQALGFMGKWVGRDTIEPTVSLKGAFLVDRTDPQEQNSLLSLRQSGELSQLTLWEEMQRRGVLSDSFNADIERERLSMEGPVGDSE